MKIFCIDSLQNTVFAKPTTFMETFILLNIAQWFLPFNGIFLIWQLELITNTRNFYKSYIFFTLVVNLLKLLL